MKVLWLTGALLPEATAQLAGSSTTSWNGTGSWILGAASALAQLPGIELYMAATSQLVSTLQKVTTSGIVSYAIPYGKGHFMPNKDYEAIMRTIRDEVQPDIVHIHGTEYSTGLAWVRACGVVHTVVSIQGMTSVYSRHFRGGMRLADILSTISFRDIIRGGILREQRRFSRRGRFEREILSSVAHVIGRTSWDRSQVWAINPNAHYHVNQETLRPQFYSASHWSLSQCTPHTIYVSQGEYPLKGLHQLIQALPLILRHYPDAQIRVAGKDPTLGGLAKNWWRRTGYGQYLLQRIKRFKVSEHITFTGPLGTEAVIEELLNSNVTVLPSAIENSPNSLGEAQMLGVPCIASYVGGVMDMMSHDEAHLYRFEEIEMLAEKVCRVFAGTDNAPDSTSIAAERHNPSSNAAQLLSIYRAILEE